MVNNTRVRAARLHGSRKDTGGKIELLLLERLEPTRWEALARPSRRLRPGVRIEFAGVLGEVVSDPNEGRVEVKFETEDLDAILPGLGHMPLPPYFTGHLPDDDRYQTMFADVAGSAAAPTAGLHFTDSVVEALSVRGVDVATVDLHVSLDTFRPMVTEDIEDHVMHSETCSIPESTAVSIEKAKENGSRVVAVGTTTVRTLESRSAGAGLVEPGEHRTDLFLRPGSTIDVVDLMVTNFHLPGSTLLVLLEAFMGPDWRQVYNLAIERGYRFLSFGDAMLAERGV